MNEFNRARDAFIKKFIDPNKQLSRKQALDYFEDLVEHDIPWHKQRIEDLESHDYNKENYTQAAVKALKELRGKSASIGDIRYDEIPAFEAYGEYCSGKPVSLEMIELFKHYGYGEFGRRF